MHVKEPKKKGRNSGQKASVTFDKKVLCCVWRKEIEGAHFKSSGRQFQLTGAREQKAAPPGLELTLDIFKRPAPDDLSNLESRD